MANSTFMVKLACVAAAVVLGACGSVKPSSSATSTGVLPNTQADRITDEAIVTDIRGIDSLQRRLMELNKAGVMVKSYNFAKAQCWLDTAKTQYHENDRTGYIEEALEQSIGLIRTIETNKAAATLGNSATPLIAGSDRLRDDLWSRLNAAKTRPGFECAAQTVACAEVRLVRAGHANQQTGWRQANPHIGMVEDALKLADRQAATCTSPSIVAMPTPTSNSSQPVALQPSIQGLERFVLLSDTLFNFDKSDFANMLPSGRIRLNAVVKQLKQYQVIERIEVAGFTDRLGSDDYNANLSGARAATVRDFLVSQGINPSKFTAVGKGKANSMSGSCSERASRAEQIACLQPDRRVEIEVFGVIKR